MGIISKFFRKKTVVVNNKHVALNNPEAIKLMNLKKLMEKQLNQNKYIAKSDYFDILRENKEIIKHFNVLKDSDVLSDFCKKNNVNFNEVDTILSQYNEFDKIVEQHNEAYIKKALIEEKDYLDNILKDVDPNIKLDENQRRVILTDEDHCLVIAGAGAGKTTTVAAKVKYLVEKKDIDPSQILVVSFTNKAVNELKEKVNEDLSIACPISTFHSVGNAILRKQTDEQLRIVQSSKLYYVVLDYFKSSVLKNETLVNNLIMFFASYFDAPYEGEDLNLFFNKIAKSNFSTMRSELDDFKKQVIDKHSKRTVTILNEVLRSQEEVEIANFLYLNNIDYEYEPVYKYNIMFSKKPYTPDFIIKQGGKEVYLEHFGITEDGQNSRYSQNELELYKKSINDKIILHRQHTTKLIYTFSKYKDKKPLLYHLQKELEKNGFVLKPKSNKEVMERLVSLEENRYIRKLVSLICRFISNFKTNGYTEDDFNRMYHETKNVRTKLFLEICKSCYLEYQRYLRENNAIDFEDMINESARVLREKEEMKEKLNFKYIIVDEYQDISRQRFDLVESLSKVTDAKIIAVGDDWQSIYAFSGSDITLFTNFTQKVGYAKILKIVNTYRNSQEVIDIAGNFIQQNKTQIKKELKSPKTIKDPVIIYTYDGTRKKFNGNNTSGANYELAHAIEIIFKEIIEFNTKEGKPKNSSILLLGRFGFDGDKLEKSGLFEYSNREGKLRSVKYPELNITFMTAHASKGLGYDNVIVVNGRNETYGFPSKIEDDPVLKFVIKTDYSIDYAEERRLFYVAMTRTKNRVFFVAPEQNPSEFLIELKQNYKNVVLRGDWNEEYHPNNIAKKICPICGYPLQYKYKNSYGLRLYICTNEPEVCGFMTNEYGAGKLSIMKCDKCHDGYMIAKKKKDGKYFLGCTNYKKDGTGCNNIIWEEQYYKLFNLKHDDKKKNFSNEAREIKRKKIDAKEELSRKSCVNDVTLKKANIRSVLYKNKDLNEVVWTVLCCLNHISQNHYYGIFTLVDVLKGSKNKKINNNQLYMVDEYAKLKFMETDDLICIIIWLIDNNYILRTKHKYPVLHLTIKGKNYQNEIEEKELKKLKRNLDNFEYKSMQSAIYEKR